jgi:hypothetical protein
MTLSTSFDTTAFSKKSLSYFFIFLFYSIVFSFSYTTTEFPSYEKIPLMDGNQYLKMWDYFANQTIYYKVNFPYNGRVFYIWLASLFSEDMDAMHIFVFLNYFFGLITLFLLFYIWNKLSFPFYQSLFLIFYLCLHWSGMIRQYMIDPVGVDIPYLLCLTILMYMVLFDKYSYLFLLTVIGTSVKEAIIPFLLFLFIIKLYNKKILYLENKKIKHNLSCIDSEVKKIFVALMAGVLCKIFINIYFPANQTGRGFNSMGAVVHYIYEIIRRPYHILDWLTGILLFFGILLFPFIKALTNKHYIKGKYGEVLLLTLLGLILAILGGGDHTRIAFLSFPFFFTFVLKYWKDNSNSFSWILYLIPSVYYSKCWLYLPTPTSNWEIFSYWYPEYSSYSYFLTDIVIAVLAISSLYLVDKKRNEISIK